MEQQKNEPDINRTVVEKSLKSINEEIATLNKQQINIFDLLEQGVYTTDQFLERSQNISERINSAKESKTSIETKLSRYIEIETASYQLMPKIKCLLDVYETLPSAAQKNELLKEIIEKIEYTKDKAGSPEDFQIVMYPKLPVKIN